MPNETQIECYFKSADLAALCKGTEDIVINFKASYAPGSQPKFEISAAAFKHGTKKIGKVVKPMAFGDGSGASGCPTPCK